MHTRMFFLWKTDSPWLKSLLLRNATALRGSTTSLKGAEVKLNSVGVGYGGRAYRPMVGRSDHWIIQKARPIHQNAPDIPNLLCPNSKKYGCQQTCSSTQPCYSFFHGLWLAHCHLWSEDPPGLPGRCCSLPLSWQKVVFPVSEGAAQVWKHSEAGWGLAKEDGVQEGRLVRLSGHCHFFLEFLGIYLQKNHGWMLRGTTIETNNKIIFPRK